MDNVSFTLFPPMMLKDALHCDHPTDVISARVKVNKIRFIFDFLIGFKPLHEVGW